MRLIDADALVYSRVRIAHEDGTIGGYNAVVMSSEIKHAPTIEAEPVRHGKWRFVNCATGLRCQCSECLHWVDSGADKNYCSYCGARMDGDE